MMRGEVWKGALYRIKLAEKFVCRAKIHIIIIILYFTSKNIFQNLYFLRATLVNKTS